MNYLFGYGSIINDASRCSTLCGIKADTASSTEIGSGGGGEWDKSIAVWLHGVGIRSWCYRSSTGFTALGLQLSNTSTLPTFGVLFPVVDADALAAFDVREKGYDRVELPLDAFVVDTSLGSAAAQQRGRNFIQQEGMSVRIWTYIPSAAYAHEPDEEHPILQSYVDVVIRGCLQWGDRNLAEQFLRSTFGWNAYYLNDTLLSRRPWLHRQDYALIDDILQSAGSVIQFHERKHPEEFAARHLTLLRGMWGVPARNSSFVGRLEHLHTLEEIMQCDGGCVSRVEVQGIGGIGKTQLCIEFCYRQYSITYGFIAWIRAETSASIAGDMRRLAFDLGIISADNKTEEESYEDAVVIEEVRRRLSRCQCRWLLVFDNANSPDIIESYLPRGQLGRSRSNRCTSPTSARGHVLITSRITSNASRNSAQTLRLECFSLEESIGYFGSVLDDQSLNNPQQRQLMGVLGEKLGHLPLALAIAAAYMIRCDVSIEEYLSRLIAQEQSASSVSFLDQTNGEISVMKSLGITLDRLCTVSLTASKVLPLLAYVSPDHINKKLICALLRHISCFESGDIRKYSNKKRILMYTTLSCSVAAVVASASLAVYSITTSLLLCVFGAICACFAISTLFDKANVFTVVQPSISLKSPRLDDEAVLAESDILWEIFVEFSLISLRGIRGAKIGSMHRLQQAVLRSRNKENQHSHLLVCALSLASLWTFCAHDSTTWSACSNYFEHIQAVSGHIAAAVSRDSSNFPVDALIQFCYVISEGALFSTIFLSRFGTAQGLLECAQSIIDSAKRKVSQHQLRGLNIISGCITHTLGKVARYQSNMKLCEKLLLATLENWTTAGDHVTRLLPHTFHELGIVYLRLNETHKAEEYFTKSLQLRKSLGYHDHNSTNTVNIERLEALIAVHESATLYQMAVIATTTKLYERAEELLLQALSMEYNARSTSRAATLQQLGRVELRRGNLLLAHDRLHEALQLYCEIYGEQRALSHVNVVAVRHQLGCVASARKFHSEACDEYSLALRGRRMIYGEDCDHIEIALEMQALGQAQFDCGYIDNAYCILKEAKTMLHNLLQKDRKSMRELDFISDISFRRYRGCLVNSLLFILHRLRKISKLKGLQRDAQRYDSEILQIKTHSTETNESLLSPGRKTIVASKKSNNFERKPTKTSNSVPSELDPVVELRNNVRTIAKKMMKAGKGDRTDLVDELKNLLKSTEISYSVPFVENFCGEIAALLDMEDVHAMALQLFTCSDKLRDNIQNMCGTRINDA